MKRPTSSMRRLHCRIDESAMVGVRFSAAFPSKPFKGYKDMKTSHHLYGMFSRSTPSHSRAYVLLTELT